jgi:asparagine synthase (glutamine-hydrolysing)
MCGIFGCMGGITPSQLKLCTNILEHRGPDGFGEWISKEVSFGHRRLAILDLSDSGKQPMESGDKRYVIIFNGEVYNFIEIRKELEGKGYVFLSDSDTEVVLTAFIEWGEECLKRFNGMWAFAIWDNQKKKLFLSRDRFGKKPLFYAFIGDQFVFASEMKAIYPLLKEIRPSADFNWMYKNIFLYESTDKCLVEGIKRFPAGHWGTYKSNQLKLVRYWNTLDHLIDIPTTYDEQAELFRELFIDACKIRMRSDVPIGTALSGGLDSSATISLMAHIGKSQPGNRVSNDWQHAFVATFPGTPLDESYYAKQVVDHLGIQATFIEIDPVKHLDKLEDYLFLFEELYLTSPIPMIVTYHAIKNHGVSVTIDGHGADELLAGYGNSLFYSFFDAKMNRKQIKDIFKAYFGLFSDENPQLKKQNPAAYLYFRFLIEKFVKKIIPIGKNYISKDINHFNFKKLDHFTRHLYVLTHETILPTLLRNYDRYSMSSGVEIRMPFMDHRIVTFVMSLPWNSKVRNGYTKAIVRDASGKFMPREVTYRTTKIGFNSPIVDWMKGPMKNYFIDHIHSQKFKECTLIDPVRVRSEIEAVIDCDNTTYQQAETAWTLITPYLWERSLHRGIKAFV